MATATSTVQSSSVIPLSNVEAQWEKLSSEEQLTVHQQLEAIQKQDWKTLSVDEKKAGTLFSSALIFSSSPTNSLRASFFLALPARLSAFGASKLISYMFI
jgi:ribonucleotide reductase beta subunit family protein with ferritin-like domain